MSTIPRPGMDHPHYDWSPLPSREPFRLPGDATLSFSVILLVEHVEIDPPAGTVQAPIPGDLGPFFPPPNLPLLTGREYGHRIGIFRMLKLCARHGLRPSVAIDAMAAERYSFLVGACADAGAEFLAHGLSVSRILSSQMSEADETAYIAESAERITAAVGTRPLGWMSPEQSESPRTPMLLDRAGFDYVCDWPNDEQPFRMNTERGLVSVPTQSALDDAGMFWLKPLASDRYAEFVIRAASRLAEDGKQSARSLVLVLRPWLSGVPFRIRTFERLLDVVTGRDDVWKATTGELAALCREQVPHGGKADRSTGP